MRRISYQNGEYAVKLGAYLKFMGISMRVFAVAAGTTHATISRVVAGRHMPGRDLMVRIVTATDGAVMPEDFYDLPEALQKSRPTPIRVRVSFNGVTETATVKAA
jgi:transcriptional regulator with XRE-family HTH domain